MKYSVGREIRGEEATGVHFDNFEEARRAFLALIVNPACAYADIFNSDSGECVATFDASKI